MFIPPKYAHAAWATCQDIATELVEEMQAWAANPAGFVLLYGPVGCGKTWLATAALKSVRAPGKRFLSEKAFLDYLFKKWAGQVTHNLGVGMDPPGFLLFDDLGAGVNEKPGMAPHVSQFLAERYDLQLPTIITTNLTIPEITDKIDGRVASRIAEFDLMRSPSKRDLRQRRPGTEG